MLRQCLTLLTEYLREEKTNGRESPLFLRIVQL